MRAINRKVFRDLWHMRGAALAIGMVLASGVATFLMFIITLNSLEISLDSFYRNYRFGDLFASLKSAPKSVSRRLGAIPGVDQVNTRVTTYVTVDLKDFPEPVTGLMVSLPDRGEPSLGRLYLHSGRSVERGRDDEVVVNRAFADAHGFRPGDQLAVTIRGKRKRLTIVGTGVSPGYIHQMRPGGTFPDNKRFGVFWMARTPLASANRMEGAFNDVSLSLNGGANAQEVIDAVDRILAPYGGTGAITRENQQSNRFLEQEFRTLRSLVGIFPLIFMGVAAFLLNVVVSRLVGTQRDQIATLKAFGYGNREVGFHYLKMVMAIVVFGTAVGTLGGTALGYWFSNIYKGLFSLPYLTFRVQVGTVVTAFLISSVSALLGAFFAVRGAARLRPAEAMRPELPAAYRASLAEQVGLQRLMGAPTRMIVRHLGHRPIKSLLSVVGVAFAVGILMTGRFQGDSVSQSMFLQFGLGQREDISIMFVDPTSRRALYDLTALPGVEYGEVFRWVPVRLRHGHRTFRTGVMGLEPGGDLARVFDEYAQRRIELPPEGIVVNDFVAGMLQLKTGERVTVEFLDGRRPVRRIKVPMLLPKMNGTLAYMDLAALNRAMEEGNAISGAYLATDKRYAHEIYARLKETPRISGIAIREREIENFHDTMDQTMLFFSFVATVFSSIIALGVVYNSARITLTERSRELASLRVLGFTRGEISYILLGELGIIVLMAIPLGLAVGYALCWYIAVSVANEIYRVPLVIAPDTYAFAVTVVVVASVFSALLVRRNLDRLDLIGVLKTRE